MTLSGSTSPGQIGPGVPLLHQRDLDRVSSTKRNKEKQTYPSEKKRADTDLEFFSSF